MRYIHYKVWNTAFPFNLQYQARSRNLIYLKMFPINRIPCKSERIVQRYTIWCCLLRGISFCRRSGAFQLTLFKSENFFVYYAFMVKPTSYIITPFDDFWLRWNHFLARNYSITREESLWLLEKNSSKCSITAIAAGVDCKQSLQPMMLRLASATKLNVVVRPPKLNWKRDISKICDAASDRTNCHGMYLRCSV